MGDKESDTLRELTHTQAVAVRIFFFFDSLILGCAGSSLLWLFSSCGERGLLSSCSAQLRIVVAPHTRASVLWYMASAAAAQTEQVQWLRRIGFVVPQYVGSSQTRD